MKKILFLLLTISITSISAVAASERMQALDAMDKSYQKTRSTCLDIARNFHYDASFSGYLKNKCALYEADRQRIVTIFYPITTQNGSDYRSNRDIYMSNYLIQLDNDQLLHYSSLITEYCKYNSFRFEKKDSSACKNLDRFFR